MNWSIIIRLGILFGVLALIYFTCRWIYRKLLALLRKFKIVPPPPVGGGTGAQGNSAGGTPGAAKPASPASHGSHHGHGVSLIGITTAAIVCFTIWAVAQIVLKISVSREKTAEHSIVVNAQNLQSKANPDNWLWKIGRLYPDGRIEWRISGITRKTVEIKGKTPVVFLSWESITLNGQVNATATVGEKGSWKTANSRHALEGAFWVDHLSNTEIRGRRTEDGETYDYVAERTVYVGPDYVR